MLYYLQKIIEHEKGYYWHQRRVADFTLSYINELILNRLKNG